MLGRTRFIRIAKGKSNREYQRELAPARPCRAGSSIFTGAMGVFESVWYGTRPVTPPDVRQFAKTQEQLRRYVEPE